MPEAFVGEKSTGRINCCCLNILEGNEMKLFGDPKSDGGPIMPGFLGLPDDGDSSSSFENSLSEF